MNLELLIQRLFENLSTIKQTHFVYVWFSGKKSHYILFLSVRFVLKRTRYFYLQSKHVFCCFSIGCVGKGEMSFEAFETWNQTYT